MSWRKELLFSNKTLAEKEKFVEKKEEKMYFILAWIWAYFSFGSFIVILFFIHFRVFGKFPKNALIGSGIWIVGFVLSYFIVKIIGIIFSKKNQKILSVARFSEEIRRICRYPK